MSNEQQKQSMSTDEDVIVIQDLNKWYGNFHVLKDINLTVKKGERIVGYDNERGKGDHRHYRDHQEPYTFVSVEQLIDDFIADVTKEREND